MISVVEQGGCQYKVSEGDTIRVPLMKADAGSEVALERVLLLSEGDDVKIGTPVVDGAEVKAKVLDHGKDEKVLVMKRKRRKDYRRKNGHRQAFTKLRITSISG
ncbi:MAG: 50S ribosomal protein L21 [Chitinivibrionales bacterium]|nr:50S ribosomal protein L21 [Chitinivibrionales bacterium]MBD3356726.1 50S ribosomal protein L21 [Chitinivibrionales bacterium]